MQSFELVIWSVLSLLVPLATLIAVAVLGRRYRPDAHRPLLVWAIASLAVFLFEHLAPWLVLPRIVASVDADHFGRMKSMLVVWASVVSIAHLALVGLFAYGLAKILRPSLADAYLRG